MTEMFEKFPLPQYKKLNVDNNEHNQDYKDHVKSFCDKICTFHKRLSILSHLFMPKNRHLLKNMTPIHMFTSIKVLGYLFSNLDENVILLSKQNLVFVNNSYI